MRFHTRVLSIVALALLSGGTPLLAQAPSAAPRTFNPQDTIPINPAVRSGTLPNGLRFLIRRNTFPAKRVSLRLGVKAGSLYENDDQQGLAHFLEHMAFNGSTHFRPGEIFTYFQSVGAQLGPHVNAVTTFDQTVFMLDLPTERPEVIEKGLTALSDFAGGLSLSPVQVERERGVVIEEWRRGLGAGSRILAKQLPAMFYQSRYSLRLPIGKPEIVRTAPVERVRAFYDAWYRPERMVVIVVGDVDPVAVEASIRAMFEPLAARAPARPEPDMRIPAHRELMVNVTADPEMTQSGVQLTVKRSAEAEQRVGDYRRMLVEQLFTLMLNDRLNVLTRRPDARFLMASAGGSALNQQTRTYTLSARAKDGAAVKDALSALAIEARRMRELGVTPNELVRAKKELVAQFERLNNERDKSESASYAAEYLRHFFTKEAIPGIEYEYALAQWAVPTITAAEVMATARAVLANEGRVVLAVVPQKPDAPIPIEADLRAALTSADRVAVAPWNDTTTTRALLETIPPPAAVVSRRELPEIGVTIVKFANGVEAWLKPTTFKNDEVLLNLYSMGGTSLAAPADYMTASFATRYVALSGFGGIKGVDLGKLLAGKRLNLAPFTAPSVHGIAGTSAPADLETALQLLYQEFTTPGADAEAFALLKRQLEAAVANRGQDPGQVYRERLAELNSCGHYVAKPITAETVAAMTPEKMFSFYRERFSNAADFTLFMVGSFNTDAVIPLLARYVGSLPSTGQRTATFTDLKLCFPTGVENVRVEKGREPRSQTVMSFFADVPFDTATQETVGIATYVLESQLRDVLRISLGQTYAVSVGLNQAIPQHGDGVIQVAFEAAPENIDGMVKRVLDEIKALQERGPSADIIQQAKESEKRTFETSRTENAYWLRRLQFVNLLNSDPKEIIETPQRLDAITQEAVLAALRKYVPLDRYTVVTLVPQPPPAAAGGATGAGAR